VELSIITTLLRDPSFVENSAECPSIAFFWRRLGNCPRSFPEPKASAPLQVLKPTAGYPSFAFSSEGWEAKKLLRASSERPPHRRWSGGGQLAEDFGKIDIQGCPLDFETRGFDPFRS